MKYALLICVEETLERDRDPDTSQAVTARYMDFMQRWGEKGVIVGGERLHPVADATTVRVRNGETLATDGPFAETKEQVGGFFVVDCKDLDEAISVASEIPGAEFGSIEVRPIWEM